MKRNFALLIIQQSLAKLCLAAKNPFLLAGMNVPGVISFEVLLQQIPCMRDICILNAIDRSDTYGHERCSPVSHFRYQIMRSPILFVNTSSHLHCDGYI